MNDATVIIAPDDSPKTIVIDGPEPIGAVIIGGENSAVFVGDPTVVVVESPAPELPAINLGPDQIGTVVIGGDSVTAILSTPEISIISSQIPGPPGPQGPPGAGAGEADDVLYENANYTTVQAALDALLYVAPKINSFTNNVGTREKGSSVASVTLAWSFNKAMSAASINQSIGAIDPTSSSYAVDGPFTSDTAWTLTANDGVNSTNASTSIAFRQKRYWGASSLDTLTDADILGLGGSEFATSFGKAVTYNCSGGKYPYFAYPASFGSPSGVTVGGLAFSDYTVATQDFTNASGYTESYHVIRFNGIQTGAAISVSWG